MTPEEMTKLGIPVEYHTDASLAEIKDLGALAKSYVETKKLVGGSLRIPGKDAGEAAIKEFKEKLKASVPDLMELPTDPDKFKAVEGEIFTRLGRPKEAKEYPALADAKVEIPEGVKIDETNLRTMAHKLGMTKGQYLDFARGVVEERSKEVTASSAAVKALKTELGDVFDERLLAAGHAAQAAGMSEDFVTRLRTGNVPPETARGWIAVAKMTGVKGSEFNKEGGGSGKMSKAEALEQIAELRKNPALTQKNHADQKRLTEKLLKLGEVAYAD